MIRNASSVYAFEASRKVNGLISINDNNKLDLSSQREAISVYFDENLLLSCSFTKNELPENSEDEIMKKRDIDSYFSYNDDEQEINEMVDYELSSSDLDESDDENDREYTWTVNGEFYDHHTFRVQLNYENLERMGYNLQFKCERKINGSSFSFIFPTLKLERYNNINIIKSDWKILLHKYERALVVAAMGFPMVFVVTILLLLGNFKKSH